MDIHPDLAVDKCAIGIVVTKIAGLSIDCEPIVRQCLGIFSRLLQLLPQLTHLSKAKERSLCSRYLQPLPF
jgi:hypothetical protein